jgi:hypothetical protein
VQDQQDGLEKGAKRQERGGIVAKNGLYANIHAKQERIKREKAEGKPVEHMRKAGSKGAPTAKDFKESAKTAKPRTHLEQAMKDYK